MYKKFQIKWLKHLDFMMVDILCIELSIIISYMLRHGYQSPFSNPIYIKVNVMMIIFDLLVSFFMESYHGILRRGYVKELKAVLIHCTLVLMLTFTYMFFNQSSKEYSRSMFFLMWALSIFFMLDFRLILKVYLRKRISKSNNLRFVVAITSGSNAEQVVSVLDENKYNDFKVAGLVVYDCDLRGREICGIPVVASIDDFEEYISKNIVDEVFISIKDDSELVKTIIHSCRNMGITVHVELLMRSSSTENSSIENFGGYTVYTSSIKMATPRQLFIKRSMDIAGGILGVIIASVAFIFVAPIILIQSPGPVFFSQDRVGKNGRVFRIYKFRSMYVDAEQRKAELMKANDVKDGLMFKLTDDPRVFPFGRFLRASSIDELPQFWNILKGDMSLVGTRPPTLDEWEKYDFHHRRRLSIKPGLTGLWQVSGRSNITDFEEVVALDTKYITEWNLAMDLRILAKTVQVVFKGDGAR